MFMQALETLRSKAASAQHGLSSELRDDQKSHVPRIEVDLRPATDGDRRSMARRADDRRRTTTHDPRRVTTTDDEVLERGGERGSPWSCFFGRAPSAEVALGATSPTAGAGEAALTKHSPPPAVPKYLSVHALTRKKKLPASTGNLHGYLAEDARAPVPPPRPARPIAPPPRHLPPRPLLEVRTRPL